MESFTFLPYPPPPSLRGNGSVNTFPWQQIHTTMEEMLDALFSQWSMPYKSRVRVSVYPLLFLGNGLVNTFLWQQKTVGGIIFYVVRVISKKVGEYFFPELLVF
jgi:ABC-type polysaccharide/polyol phosphate export permease